MLVWNLFDVYFHLYLWLETDTDCQSYLFVFDVNLQICSDVSLDVWYYTWWTCWLFIGHSSKATGAGDLMTNQALVLFPYPH